MPSPGLPGCLPKATPSSQQEAFLSAVPFSLPQADLQETGGMGVAKGTGVEGRGARSAFPRASALLASRQMASVQSPPLSLALGAFSITEGVIPRALTW